MTHNQYRVKKNAKYNYWSVQFRASRQLWSLYDPERQKCLDLARVKENGVYRWKCAHCGGKFDLLKKEIQVDHIVPIGVSLPQTKEQHDVCWDKMQVHHTQLQALCCACHTVKTNLEREAKRENAA